MNTDAIRAAAIVDRAEELRKEPTPGAVRAWLLARLKFATMHPGPDREGRVARLAKLAADDRYCELVAECQKATTAMAIRREQLIGKGTT